MGGEASLYFLSIVGGYGHVIQRARDGKVRVVSPGIFGGSTSIHEERDWTVKGSPDGLQQHLKAHAPMASEENFADLLMLAYYVLSTAHVGATFVWHITGEAPDTTNLKGECLSYLELAGTRKYTHPTIANLLSQRDGATFLNRDTVLLETSIKLNPSKESQCVPEYRGTRHTSARRYSYDHPECVLLVVSEDGPVTVISDGAIIGEVKSNPAWLVTALRKKDGSLADEAVTIENTDVVCKTCGKSTQIRVLASDGENSERSAECLVCGAHLATRTCSALESQLLKK